MRCIIDIHVSLLFIAPRLSIFNNFNIYLSITIGKIIGLLPVFLYKNSFYLSITIGKIIGLLPVFLYKNSFNFVTTCFLISFQSVLPDFIEFNASCFQYLNVIQPPLIHLEKEFFYL